MAFDYKKEYKEFYMPGKKPEIIDVPEVNYVAVRGCGNPNDSDGAYKDAVGVLYAIAYTIKMSYKGDHRMDGYFQYVVPPLEGFWWQTDEDGNPLDGMDYNRKVAFHWISVIRLPEFVTEEEFNWAVETATKKKKMDCSKAEFLTINEGLCVQIMHIGSFDDEPASVALMDEFLERSGCEGAAGFPGDAGASGYDGSHGDAGASGYDGSHGDAGASGYENDFSYVDELGNDKTGNVGRIHHEIYLSDPRKCAPEKCKTVIRHPIKVKF